MASFNKITIVGYLGKDPELKFTPQGVAVCTFSIATTDRKKDQNGEYQDHTTWFRVTCFNRTAENANEYLSKGKQVFIDGRLRLETYTDREGRERSSLEVVANEVHFLGTRSDSADSPARAPQAAAMKAQRPAEQRVDWANVPEQMKPDELRTLDDSDIPF